MIKSRPLSQFENFFRSRTASKFYKNFQVTASFNNDISPELLFSALRKTLLDYHILICNVFQDKGGCVFRPIEQARFADVVAQEDPAKYLVNGVVTENYMATINEITFTLNTEAPLFKIIMLGYRHLSVILEHTIADGLVGNFFHEILVENLAFVDNPKNKSVLKEQYGIKNIANVWEQPLFKYKEDDFLIKNSLPPPVDAFMEPVHLDYTYGDESFFEKEHPNGLTKKWEGLRVASKDDKLAFKLIHFDSDQMKFILAACKKNGVTLTAFLTAVLATTIAPHTDKATYTTHKVATSLRRNITVENSPDLYKSFFNKDSNYRILGSSAWGYATNLPPVESFDWEVAKKINKNIKSGATNRRGVNTLYGFIKDASPTDTNLEFFERGLGKPKADTVKISNLGLVKTPDYSAGERSWRISELFFSQDVSPSAAEYQLNVIASADGLNLVLSFFAELDGLQNVLHDNILEFADKN